MTEATQAAPVQEFLTRGFICLRNAIAPDLAEAIATQVWDELRVVPDDPATWPGPVAHCHPFGPRVQAAAASPTLTAAVDLLAGKGQWQPRDNLGVFVARFPTGQDSHDTGWHIDSSYHPDDLPWPQGADEYRVNIHTRGRALLLLPLFTTISEADAPTRIQVGSHVPMARALAAAGGEGVTDASRISQKLPIHEIALATGSPGDVYVCHPFLVHAAQLPRGRTARLIAQPGIAPLTTYTLDRPPEECAPVERAIVNALDRRRAPGEAVASDG